MSEGSKEHDWKSCIPLKGIVGSNPTLSANRNLIRTPRSDWVIFIFLYLFTALYSRFWPLKLLAWDFKQWLLSSIKRRFMPWFLLHPPHYYDNTIFTSSLYSNFSIAFCILGIVTFLQILLSLFVISMNFLLPLSSLSFLT